MQYDIIEFEPKKYKIKIVLTVILIVIFIALFSFLGIYYAKVYNISIIKKRKERIIANQNKSNEIVEIADNNNSSASSEKETNIGEREHVKRTLLPVYSENAKKQMKNIYNNKTKVAYLTFDDGPSSAVTPLILDLLKEENIKATFFVLGKSVINNSELVKREYQEGHYIANHGYTHNYSKIYNDAENVLNEYNKTEKCIQEAIGNSDYKSHLFRFPGGYYGGKYAKIKKEAAKILNENDISYIDWNCLSKDAEGANTKEKILDNIKTYSKDKGTLVVLMHDASTKILTYETLKDVIDYLRSEGYVFENFYNIMQ